MNASLYLGLRQDIEGAVSMASLCVPLIQVCTSSGSLEVGDVPESHTDAIRLNKWTEIIAWVRKWDDAQS
jgi:hypothetical protein